MLRPGFKVRLLMLPTITQKIKTKVLEHLDSLSKCLAGKDKGWKGLKESDSNIRICFCGGTSRRFLLKSEGSILMN